MKIAVLVTDNREPFKEYQNPTPWFGTAPEALLQGFARMPEVEVHVVTCTQRPMKSPTKLADNIYFHSLHVPKIGWMRSGYLGCIWAMRRKLREIRPDIVHGQGTERECSLSAVFSGFPNVLTIHGNMRMIAKFFKARIFSFNWLAARLEALALPRANGIVCISTYTLKAVKGLAQKTWLLPNAVDEAFFDLKLSPANPPRILCVGNIDARKNQNALMQALDAVPGPKNFQLIFLGVPRESAYTKEFLKMVTERPWCRFKGFTDREGLRNHMAAATGLTLPTLEDNCPMVVLEAMAAGVPVAAAKVGGVPDLVRDETGLLFDPLKPEAMAEATMSLLSFDTKLRAACARKEAFERFHPRVIAEKHFEIYREVISCAAN